MTALLYLNQVLKDYPEAKGVQFRIVGRAGGKQLIQIVINEKVGRSYAKLNPHSVTEVLEVKVVLILILFFIAIFFIHYFTVAADAVAGIRADADAEFTSVRIPESGFIPAAAKVKHGYKVGIYKTHREFALGIISGRV